MSYSTIELKNINWKMVLPWIHHVNLKTYSLHQYVSHFTIFWENLDKFTIMKMANLLVNMEQLFQTNELINN
jgi:hypothetical protein